MGDSTEVCQFELCKVQLMPLFDHGTDNLGENLDLVDVFRDLRIRLSNVFFIIVPVHIACPFLLIQSCWIQEVLSSCHNITPYS